MRIQPREQLLTLWRSVVEVSLQDEKWKWGGRYERNSISDAEQLLTIMYPATELTNFRLHVPDRTAPDVLDALKELGDAIDIPQRLVDALIEHIEHYTDDDGPSFPGGSYFKSNDPERDPTPDQLKIDMVDSFSMAVTLMLNTLGFVRGFNASENADLVKRLEHLESIASQRLTAAMVGLLRSFVINVFTPDSQEGRSLLRSVNQSSRSPQRVAEELRISLQEIRASLGDVTFGFSGAPPELLENRNRLFEIGWTWGVADDAPKVEIAPSAKGQRIGVAESAPFLYFTVNALDGIADLFSGRTTVLGLLDEDQQRLATALRLRWELTQRYWSTIATFGEGTRWPLEDLPWRTTDNKESEHFSLLIASLLIQDLQIRKTVNVDLRRVADILDELGQRGRVTRRAASGDFALQLHVPGTEIQLGGTRGVGGGPSLYWRLNDYAPLLLKNTLRLARLVLDSDVREQLVQSADQIWEHLAVRRIDAEIGTGLWDDAAKAFENIQEHNDLPSWYYTERVVECIVMTVNLMSTPPPRSLQLLSYARDILNEADNLFDLEVLDTNVVAKGNLSAELEDARHKLIHAREIVTTRPATSVGLAMDVLRLLERVSVARGIADEGAG